MRAIGIVNAAAPRLGPAILSELHAALGARDLYLTDSAAEAREVLELAMTGPPLAVIVGGGDGTLTSALTAATGLAAERGIDLPAFGLVPLGTANAFAKYAASGSATDLVAAARAGHTRRRLGSVTALDQVGLFCGFGVDAQIIDDHATTGAWLRRRGLAALSNGRVGYALSVAARTLPGFATRRRPVVTAINRGIPAAPLDRTGHSGVSVPAGQTLWTGPLTLAACASITRFGFGLEMFAHGDTHLDRFQVRLSDASLFEILANTRAAFRGDYFSRRTHDFWCDALELRLDTPSPFEIGGELCGQIDTALVEAGPVLSLI